MVTLETSKLFSHLPKEELARLQEQTKELRCAAGQEIFKEGDPGDGVYVVKSGSVEISAVLAGGERQVFSRILPGDVFGEMTLLDRHPRSATAMAQQASELYFVPRAPMVELLQRCPEVSLKLIQEISERLREFDRQYVQKVLQAERTALVGRFASSIVHDLKNPLTIISIAAQSACRAGATPESRQNALDRINKQVDHITTMVNDILEFTRGPQTKPALCLVYFDEFVESVTAEFAAELAPQRVLLELQDRPPSVKLLLNPKRLSRVFHNLIRNAVDAMPDGGIIRIRFQTTERVVTTEVEDTGTGIPPEVLPRIFEAFVTQGKAKGTGLGLAIAQRILEEHGGQISARNREGGGAVFSFSLPIPS